MLSKPISVDTAEPGQMSRPWWANLDLVSGALWPASHVVTCRLSDMAGRYRDQAAEKLLMESEDPLIYRADEIIAPEKPGHLHTSVTVLYPGRVGDEYFMSKGHYHVHEECVKVYLCVRGRGYLLMQSADRETSEVFMTPGTIAYCPPGWAQRTVNVGAEPFAYFKYWPAYAGHDYDRVLDEGGFVKRVVARDDIPIVVNAVQQETAKE